MNIGIVIGRIGGVDGVALETEKWITVLKRLGHRVHLLTGELEAPLPRVQVLPELAFDHPAALQDQQDAFFLQEVAEADLMEHLGEVQKHIKREILAWIQREKIDLLLPENASTLPFHLSMGVVLQEIMVETGIPAVSHNHDFRWERGGRYSSRYPAIQEILERCFPPVLENLRHAVINQNAKKSLRERYGVDSVVVPNVMDFQVPFARRDAYNQGLLVDLGLPEGALPLFQITRIVRRKGIETAIELVGRLEDPRVHLVITGQAKDDFSSGYLAELQQQARDLEIEERIHFAGDRFDNVRREDALGRKVYSLEDAYTHAVAMTYFSSYEGFGNAFVEAVLARVPILVNDYLPVYWPDIGSKGFRTIQIEGGRLTGEAVEETRRWLAEPELRQEVVEENYLLGQKHFSYEVLAELLQDLLE
jgi:glycosyltransferase involved in cell wall biosynthesis